MPKEVYTFWLDGIINELRFLFEQHPALRTELLAVEAFAPILIYVDAEQQLSETEITAITQQYATLKPQLALPYN